MSFIVLEVLKTWWFSKKHFNMVMSVRKKRRLLVIITAYLCIVYFAINSYLLDIDERTYNELIRSLKIIARRNRFLNANFIENNSSSDSSINSNSNFNSLPIVDSGNWIFNPRVAQYSAYLTYSRLCYLNQLIFYSY